MKLTELYDIAKYMLERYGDMDVLDVDGFAINDLNKYVAEENTEQVNEWQLEVGETYAQFTVNK